VCVCECVCVCVFVSEYNSHLHGTGKVFVCGPDLAGKPVRDYVYITQMNILLIYYLTYY